MKRVKRPINFKKEAFRQFERMHPHKMLLFVSMFGSALIFLFMMVAFAASSFEIPDAVNFRFPKIFFFSTIILIVSSFSMSKVMPSFVDGNFENIIKCMAITLFLGMVFAVFQFLGWQELRSFNVFFDSRNSGAYLYVISGLHVLHVFVAMIYLVTLLIGSLKASKDGVKKLVYETNQYKKVKFDILQNFWHFNDVLWFLIFLYFFFTF